LIRLEGVSKSYDNASNVVDKLDLEIKTGELVVLVGESGCGKTTTMKMINRLIEPTNGNIFIDEDNIRNLNKNELRRNIGYVIQNVGLFPHLTIDKNIAVVPTLCKVEKNEIDAKVKQLLDMIELPYEDYAHRYPRELSGGQQQRVGVARALANDPDIILMDEPFSALDPITREQLQNELLKLQESLNKTIVFVTHDITEAIKLGDRIAVMANGSIVQYDTPEKILKNPVNKFVEMFVGYDRLWKTPEMLKAKDVVNRKMITIEANKSVSQALELMKKHDTPVLAVVHILSEKQIEFVGMVDSNNLIDIVNNEIKVSDIMKVKITKIPYDMVLVDILSNRKENNIQYSPVFDENDNILGFITNASILNVLTDIIPEREVS
jgi:osmoprotectant transport system ATP-binding protein